MITMLKQGKDYITDKHGIYTEYVCSSATDVANLQTCQPAQIPRPRTDHAPAAQPLCQVRTAAPHPCMCFQMSVLGCC